MEVLNSNYPIKKEKGCLKEVIRQVSIQCVDRGELLHKIFNTYIAIIENIIIKQQKLMQLNEQNNLKAFARFHKM